MSFSLEIANEKFLSDSTPLLKKGFELLAEILTNPNISEMALIKKQLKKKSGHLKQEFNLFLMIKCAIPMSAS